MFVKEHGALGCAHLLLLVPWLCVGRCLQRPFLGSACRAFISAALNGRWQSSQRRRGRETRFCCSAPRPAAFLLRYENGSSFQLGKALLSISSSCRHRNAQLFWPVVPLSRSCCSCCCNSSSLVLSVFRAWLAASSAPSVALQQTCNRSLSSA